MQLDVLLIGLIITSILLTLIALLIGLIKSPLLMISSIGFVFFFGAICYAVGFIAVNGPSLFE